MMAISRDAVPRTNFMVRRRRFDEAIWLVRYNDWYVLDDPSDYVWRGCEASWTVEEIIKRMAVDQDMSLADAMAATVYALGLFRELGFLTWDDVEDTDVD
ncbi:MAG: hypothetical protein U9R25_00065 [Chloroflexota bacterium]|nr:hypothetical protein [Chloroflexota bacterium]